MAGRLASSIASLKFETRSPLREAIDTNTGDESVVARIR